jgi:NTE family protein
MNDHASDAAAALHEPVSMPKKKVLVLQGGGALGSYQAGAYEALHETLGELDWVAGVSIGAINAALIAGNAPERRVDRLREFWDLITAPSAVWPDVPMAPWQMALRQAGAASALLFGQPGFFRPRPALEWLLPGAQPSFYTTGDLHATLERLVDFDRINHYGSADGGGTRLSLGATEIETGNLVVFDSHKQRLGALHVMASGALPPGFPAVEIEGRHYWDGGLVSNTPLQFVMEAEPRMPMLIFQVDLFSARGPFPTTLDEQTEREKDIQYSSRTRANTDRERNKQNMRNRIHQFLAMLPEAMRNDPVAQYLRTVACPASVDIVHLIYRPAVPQGGSKDFEFSRATMLDRWRHGFEDGAASVAAAPWKVPHEGVRTFDVMAKKA